MVVNVVDWDGVYRICMNVQKRKVKNIPLEQTPSFQFLLKGFFYKTHGCKLSSKIKGGQVRLKWCQGFVGLSVLELSILHFNQKVCVKNDPVFYGPVT